MTRYFKEGFYFLHHHHQPPPPPPQGLHLLLSSDSNKDFLELVFQSFHWPSSFVSSLPTVNTVFGILFLYSFLIIVTDPLSVRDFIHYGK
jgi:hypothetical protein